MKEHDQAEPATSRAASRESFWSRFFSRRRGEKLRGMARVRVYARVGQNSKVPMVGLLPREALDEIRRRLGEARRSGQGACHLEASPKSLEKVRVLPTPDSEPQAAWKIQLGIRVREGEEHPPPAARRRVRVELEDLLPAVELVAETAE